MTEVYSTTTAPNPKNSCFLVPSKLLDWNQFILKAAEVVSGRIPEHAHVHMGRGGLKA